MLTTESRPLPNADDKAALKRLAAQVILACPSLHDSAHQVAADLLQKHGIRGLDPDHVYFHRFKAAQSSNKSFTGWEHIREQAHDSQTLTQLVIHRFRATDQDNADLLDLWAGFYTAGPGFGDFNETNEVRLHGSDVLKDFWSINFSERYTEQLNTFWSQSAQDFRTLAKSAFLSKTVQALDSRRLSESDCRLVFEAVAPGLTWPVNLATLQTQRAAGLDAQLYAMDIDGHVATDLLRIVIPDSRQFLYVPGEDQGLYLFDTPAQLHWWVLEQMNDETLREKFLYHFPLAERQQITDGLSTLMNRLVDSWGKSDHRLINQKNQAISGDPFTWLRDSTRTAMFAEAQLSLTSNGDLRKKLWIGYLSAGLKVFGPMAVIGWPVALPVIGASLASLGLNIDQAANGKTAAERKAGVIGVVLNSIDTLFNLTALKGPGPLLEMGEEVEAAIAVDTAEFKASELPEGAPPAEAQTVLPAVPPAILPVDDTAPGVEIPSAWQINELLDDSARISEPGQYQGIYTLREAPWYAIQIDDAAYYVRYEKDVNGPGYWSVIDPNASAFSKPIPVRLNAEGRWVSMPRAGLAGGGKFLNKLLARRPVLPVPENPASAYEIPLENRAALETSAGSPYAKRYAISDEGTTLGPEDPYTIFKARRQQLFKDAAAFYNRFSPGPRPPVPTLPTNANAETVLRTLLHDARAVVVGETHASVGSKQLLIDKMDVLAEQNVKTLYLEHLLTDFHQVDLDLFAETGTMPDKLRRYLQTLDDGQHTDPLDQYNFLELVETADSTRTWTPIPRTLGQ